MATTLPVNFKDDILGASMNGKRRYQLISNSDGTYSLEDVTEYTQEGSNFGAAQINATNTAVNESIKDMGSYSGDLDALEAGVFSVSLSNCTNTPVSSGSAIVVSVPYRVQTLYLYDGDKITRIYVRVGKKLQSVSLYGGWSIAYGGYELIRGGLTPTQNRCSITDGGYFIIGNMCYFSLSVKILKNLSGNNFWGIVENMPRPLLSKVAVSVSNMNNGTAMAATVNQGGDGKYGLITFRTKDALAVNDEYSVSGWYMLQN